MKKLTILGVIIMALLLPVMSACSTNTSEAHTPIPSGSLPSLTGVQAPDDIVITPGGVAYRANVHQVGVADLWPSIPSANVTLGSGSNSLNVRFRDYIETKAGETRNDIIDVYRDGGLFNNTLALYSVAVPAGTGLSIVSGGGLIGELRTVLAITIRPDVAPGQYTFKIGIEVDGKDYGTIPCAIKVIK